MLKPVVTYRLIRSIDKDTGRIVDPQVYIRLDDAVRAMMGLNNVTQTGVWGITSAVSMVPDIP